MKNFLNDRLIAHRGVYYNCRENTISAFKEAIKRNYIIELDVRLTKDKKVIVFHDLNLLRLTGINKNISTSTYDELNSIINIPTLEEAIKYLEKIIEYFYPGESSVCVDRVELRSRLHQVEGMDDYILGDYVSDYLSGTYNLGIRQMMNGIPIYMEVGGKMSPELTKKKPELWKRKVRITGIASNFFEFMNEKSFMLNSIWMKKSMVIEEDVPLKDIDVIIKKIEEKILAGNIRNVYALKLGYCVYFDELDETGYVLYPIWICECAYVESAKEELRPLSWVTDDREQPYYKRIVINAQTGEIEPMVITDEKQIYCPTVVTW